MASKTSTQTEFDRLQSSRRIRSIRILNDLARNGYVLQFVAGSKTIRSAFTTSLNFTPLPNVIYRWIHSGIIPDEAIDATGEILWSELVDMPTATWEG